MAKANYSIGLEFPRAQVTGRDISEKDSELNSFSSENFFVGAARLFDVSR